ncbi:hypothetical protein [Methanobrevibacter sp.]|uniref:hypothetical protein n=1 Tax=Methanobrevibacter sp. TaxID=66852 RepID=UPI00388F5EB7
MNKYKLAKTISVLTNPPIITIPLFLIICIVLSFENGGFDFFKFIQMELISLIFASLLPMAIIVFWAKKINTDNDISNREDRFVPLIVGIVSYFIGFIVCLFLNVSNFLALLLLCYSVNTGVVLIFTIWWKISVHTTGLSGPVAALILLLGPIGAIFAILYPIVIWSRVLLKKHTMAQAVTGGVQGFFLTVLEIYLFSHLLNMPLNGLVSLEESILYILAIIATPVVLGILSYVNLSNKKIIFYISQAVFLILFYFLSPFNVFAIFVVICLTSILISYWAGEEFVWFNVLNS